MTQGSKNQHTPIALIGGGLTTQVVPTLCIPAMIIWFSGEQKNQTETKDTRTTTIHHAGQVMLDALGIWESLKTGCPVTQIAVATAQQTTDNNRSNKGRPYVGNKLIHPWPGGFKSGFERACENEITIQLSKQKIQLYQ